MQLTIRMPDEQMNRIENIAKKLGLKKSDVTRMAIKKFIEEYNDSSEKPFTKVKHLIGIAESGVFDLGQRHRHHLIKKIKGDGK
jgi:metal-responsive CopG/Arc/MetJ family transcriptional regulator